MEKVNKSSSFEKNNLPKLLVFLFLSLLLILASFKISEQFNNFGFKTIDYLKKIFDQPIPTISPRVELKPINDLVLIEIAMVKRVVDGDTIELTDGRKVRYIGINSPELHDPRTSVECFANEAYLENKKLVENREVELKKDVSDKDKYSRLLRYVYVGGKFVNEYLVENGFAEASTFPPDVKYQKLLLEKEKLAREEKRGLWKQCAN